MIVPLWVYEVADEFWQAAGTFEAFPRTLRRALLHSPFDVSAKEITDLRTAKAEDYLSRLGPEWRRGGPDRPLRACLAARDGAGFILLDAADPPAERVFSLAHELAHFLWHYLRPRQRAVRLLGAGGAEVFDGARTPTPAERLRGLLSNVSMAAHLHLMERGPNSQIGDSRVATAEGEADRLAYELLAPAEAVAALGATSRQQVAAALARAFGLPTGRAEDYSHLLWPAPFTDSLIHRLRGDRAIVELRRPGRK